MSEASVEAACCTHARRAGVLSVKLQGNVAGDPDRLFLLPGQRCWLVEFKSAVGRLSPRQRVRHAELELFGHPVSVVRSVKEFRTLLDMYLQGTA